MVHAYHGYIYNRQAKKTQYRKIFAVVGDFPTGRFLSRSAANKYLKNAIIQ